MTFNLITEPCVPVLDNEKRQKTLSLQDALLQAHTIDNLSHDSPVVTASLMRLLVALLADSFAPKHLNAWREIWESGRLDEETIGAYFVENHDRFDLFNPQYPFYQTARLEDDNPVNLNLFAIELATGNNPTLFSHSLDSDETDYTPVQAFHLLIAAQNFSLAGLLRRTTTLEGETIYWQSAYSAPLIPGAVTWLEGNNLFETLMLNLIPKSILGEDDESHPDDIPAWRMERPADLRDTLIGKSHNKIGARGYRDRLTWQSRLIRLLPIETKNGTIVRRACFNHGRSADNGQNSYDPMLAYRRDEKRGDLVVRLSDEKASWRDMHALIGVSEAGVKKTPDAMGFVSEVEGLPASYRLRVNVAGLANDQAKVLLWRHDRYALPLAVLKDRDDKQALTSALRDLTKEAEDMAYFLWGKTRDLCTNFLAPMMHDPLGKPLEGGMKADKDRVSALAQSIDPRSAYWARLESGFQRLLLHIADDEGDASEEWRDALECQARIAFGEAVSQLGDSVRAIKAEALANAYFKAPSRRPPPVPKTKTRKGKTA